MVDHVYQPFSRCMVFIDNSNLIHSLQRVQPGLRVSYKKLVDSLSEGRHLIRSYVFSSYNPQEESKAQKFYDALSQQGGFEVVAKPVRNRGGGTTSYYVEKGVDVALVTCLLSHAFRDNYDIAIIVSGDEDYVEAVRVVKDLGKNVEVASFNNSISRDLRLKADRFVSLDVLVESIRM